MQQRFLVFCAVILLYSSCPINAARILGIFHFPSRSHHILGSTLLKALAQKGHQVTMMSPYPEQEPVQNYTDIDFSEVIPGWDKHFKTMVKLSILKSIATGFKVMQKVAEPYYSDQKVKELLQSEKFDLVIQGWFFNEELLGIAETLDVPVIALNVAGTDSMVNIYSRNPSPYSYVPNILLSATDKMTFLQRLGNTVAGVLEELLFSLVVLPWKDSIYKENFPNGRPLKEVIEDRVALYFVNSHYSTESPRPYLPNVIPIGGFSIQDQQKVPKDIQEFMDNAKDGFVYVSFGSNVKAAQLNDQQKDAIVKTLFKQKLKVLWKFDEDVPNKPSNIKIAQWMPQKAIIAHPNIKVFVTHGGKGGISEAMYNGVPIVGIPFFADQFANIEESTEAGYGEQVTLEDLTEESFSSALGKVLDDPSYRNKIQMRSSIFKEQPMKPLDKAIFWVEHVIQHKGAKHLKSFASKLPFYQYYLLDVIAFILGVAVIGTIATYWITKKILGAIYRKLFG